MKGVGWAIAIAANVALFFALLYWASLVRAVMRRRLVDMEICSFCGYDLTENVSGRCPECGMAVNPADAGMTDSGVATSGEIRSGEPMSAHANSPPFAFWKDPYRWRLFCRGVLVASIVAVFILVCSLSFVTVVPAPTWWQIVLIVLILDFGLCCLLGMFVYAVAAVMYFADRGDLATRVAEWGTACIWWWLLPLAIPWLIWSAFFS
jgi:hypothetical protein